MLDRQALTSWRETEQSAYLSPGVILSRRFYAWEIRGRGWHLWPRPVRLEPPFCEFRHRLPAIAPELPRRPAGLLDSLSSLFGGRSTAPAVVRAEPDIAPEEEFAASATELSEPPDLVELRVAVPKSVSASRDLVEQFLLVSTAAGALGFEIIGMAGSIVLQMVATRRRAGQVREQLKAHFPGVVVTESPQFLISSWLASDGTSLVVDFGLSNEFMRPIKTAGSFTPDPLIAVVAALEGLAEGEIGVFQVLCERAESPWRESIVRAVEGEGGTSFIAELPDLVASAREKIRGTLFAAVIRVAAKAQSSACCRRIVQGLGAALGPVALAGSNELIPLANDSFPEHVHAEDLLLRVSHRCGMLLSSGELMTLVHLPTPAVASRTLARVGKRTAPAPKIAEPVDCLLGTNVHEGVDTPVGLSCEQRLQHMYVVGGSGTGKSTLLRNLVVQDILAGRGCAILDPHGDLVDDILRYIPEDRMDDVVLFDPADTERPVGFNVLEARTELEKNLLASDLVSVFRRFSTSWGDQMSTVLGNAIIALLESPQGGTLADLRRFLVEREFRCELLSGVADPEVRYWWEKQFPLLRGTPYASVLTRLDAFLRPKPVRYVVAQKDACLDLGEIMRSGTIFLGKLAQGLIGEENAHLLGSLIVSKFHQLAMARQAEARADRRDFYLYVDEFHHFVSPSMAAILAGARKYRLGLTLANQELRAVGERDWELLSSILANAYTRVMFRVADEDARKLAEGLSSFDAKDLQNLGRGEAIVRVERAENDFNLATDANPSWLEASDEATVELVRRCSRAQFGRDVTEIERELTLQYAAARAHSKEEPVRQTRSGARAPEATGTRKDESRQDAAEVGTIDTPPTRPPKTEAPVREAVQQEDARAPAPERTPEAEPSLPSEPAVAPTGKGGPEHRRLQRLLKAYGEDRGFRTTIERAVRDGSIDVALEREGFFIACEISVSTNAEHELRNIKKCVAAGADWVVVLVVEDRSRAKLAAALAADESSGKQHRVLIESPDTVLAALDRIVPDAAGGDPSLAGWKVTTSTGSPDGGSPRKPAGAKQAILNALARLREKNAGKG